MGSLGIAGDTNRFEPFRVGSALSDAFGIMSRNLPLFLGISLIANIPNLFIYYKVGLTHGGDGAYSYILLEILSERFFGALSQAMLLYAAFQYLRGRSASIFESVGHGLARFLPVILTSILVTVIIFSGVVLLVIPGFIASAGLVVAIPACVVERLGPFKSLSRSFSLTSGYKGAIFGVLFGIGIVNSIIAIAIGAITLATRAAGTYAFLLYAWVTPVSSYIAVVSAIIYHGLRVDKEGVDLEQIASVFD